MSLALTLLRINAPKLSDSATNRISRIFSFLLVQFRRSERKLASHIRYALFAMKSRTDQNQSVNQMNIKIVHRKESESYVIRKQTEN